MHLKIPPNSCRYNKKFNVSQSGVECAFFFFSMIRQFLFRKENTARVVETSADWNQRVVRERERRESGEIRWTETETTADLWGVSAFTLPPSPGRVDILEDLSRSLSFSLFPDDVSIILHTHTHTHTHNIHIHTSGLLVARADLPDRFNSPCATGQEERKRVGCGSPLEYRDSRLSVTRSSSSASDKSPSFHFRCNARGKLEFYAARI